jgi:electron transport complex protein RnfG
MSSRGEQPLTRHDPASARSLAGSLAGLAAIVLTVALLVGVAWQYARQRIADNESERALAEISTVLPANLYDNQPHLDSVVLDTGSGQPLPVYRARWNGAPVGAALTIVAPGGFVGPIRLLVGIGADGRVLGVRVAAHSETPGIGDAIESGKSAWLRMFYGRSLSDPPALLWNIREDSGEFDAIAGATVSSRAVVGGVRRAVQYFATHRAEIFAPTGDEARNGMDDPR